MSSSLVFKTSRVLCPATPNPSIERTPSSKLRLLLVAAHVER